MTTLPAFLFNNYKRYKEDTNRIATWLVETAQKYGHNIQCQSSATDHHIEGQPSASSRLKGKARKQARKAAKASRDTSITTQITITVREFTDLAERIAQLKPRVKVPEFILGRICSAISLRKHCTTWFQKNQDQEENEGHSHFIRVLERVLQILEPDLALQRTSSVKEQTRSRKFDTRVDSEMDKLTNIYDVLTIDENTFHDDAETPLTTTNAQKDASFQSTPPPPRKTYEMERTEEDFVFAISCLLSDLNELRKFLRTLWIQYKDGTLDLITVSLTTNTAINLASRAELDLYSTFPTIQSPFEVILKLFSGVAKEDPSELECLHFEKHSVSETDDVNFLSITSPLKKFCNLIRRGGLNIIYNSDSIPDHTTFTSLDPKEDENKFFMILMEVFLLSQMGDPFVPDEITAGLAALINDDKFQLWIVYATQIFLDINKILQDDVSRGLSDLQASGTYIVSVLKKYNSILPCSCQQLPALNSINTFIDRWILGDILDQLKDNLRKVKAIRSSTSAKMEPFLLFKRHPLICGLFQFQLHAYVQYHTINLVNMAGSVLCAAYLYESCRQAGYLKQSWPDMELVMDIHTREKMFLGRIPQAPAEFLKCTQLMLGMSLVSRSPTARSCSLNLTNKRKCLTPTSSVMNVFCKEWLQTKSATLTINTVEGLLNASNVTSTFKNVAAPEKDQSLLQRQWAKSHKMTPLQLLETLHLALAAERHILHFDYLSLHLRCLSLLLTLGTVFPDKSLRCNCHHHSEKEAKLLVVDIFSSVSDSDTWVLKRASEVVNEFIEREGSVERDRLANMMLHRDS